MMTNANAMRSVVKMSEALGGMTFHRDPQDPLILWMQSVVDVAEQDANREIRESRLLREAARQNRETAYRQYRSAAAARGARAQSQDRNRARAAYEQSSHRLWTAESRFHASESDTARTQRAIDQMRYRFDQLAASRGEECRGVYFGPLPTNHGPTNHRLSPTRGEAQQLLRIYSSYRQRERRGQVIAEEGDHPPYRDVDNNVRVGRIWLSAARHFGALACDQHADCRQLTALGMECVLSNSEGEEE